MRQPRLRARAALRAARGALTRRPGRAQAQDPSVWTGAKAACIARFAVMSGTCSSARRSSVRSLPALVERNGGVHSRGVPVLGLLYPRMPLQHVTFTLLPVTDANVSGKSGRRIASMDVAPALDHR